MTALRVLVVTNMWPRPDRPAFGIFVAEQVAALGAAGLDMHRVVIEGDRNSFRYLSAISAVRARVRQLQPDLVHAHFGLSAWVASWQPRPLVVSFCGDDLLGGPRSTWRARARSAAVVRLSRSAARRADAIICKSPNLRAALPGTERERAVIIPNGVDLRRFFPADKAAARATLGIPRDRRVVLFPHDRSQPEQKRFRLAELAVESLAARGIDAELLHISGLPHSSMPAYFQAADCMLLTSRSEGSPNTLKEALACNCPVVSVEVGDARHWLDRVPGCAIVAPSPEAIAAGVATVLAAPRAIDASQLWPELAAETATTRLRSLYQAVAMRESSRRT